ncbi:MAG TPA: HlyD family efflux transporter periplasmic adaptor subunit, partial [Phycisphaeraceae bacterium]
AGLVSLAGRGEEWLHQARDVLAADNLPWLYASLVLIKALHELGHGVACKRMGRQERVSGEVHTLGVMLLALLPVPYVDASSAWAFRSKWRRAVVGVAGMYVELAAAAVAAVIWSRTAQGTAVHIIAHNAMLIASVSTVLFNANPLLRFDGYYILSDLLEIPNLSQRSQEYLSYLARRYALGVRRAVNPAQGRSERFWLAFYGVASSFYRVVVALGVALFVLERFFFIGALLLIGSVVGWVVLPMGKMVRYLLTDAELTRVRGRALAVSGGAAACVVVLTGVVPMPQRGTAQGVVEPRQWAGVFMGADGFVQQVLPSGQQVSPGGAVLVEARSATLTAHLEELRARRDAAEAQFRQTRLVNVAAAMALAQQIEALDGQIQRAKEEQAALRVEPPLAGVWLAPDLEQRVGAYVRRGEPLGVVATLEELVVRVAADQYLGPRLAMEAGEGQAVRMRIDGQPRWTYTGAIERILPAGQRRLPSPALGRPSGGAVAVSPEAEAGDVTAEPFFEVRIRPDDPPAGAPPLLAGQRVVVRFELPPRPMLAQVWQSLRQLMQRRLHI